MEGRVPQKPVLPHGVVRDAGVAVFGPRVGEARRAEAVEPRAEREELVHEVVVQGGAVAAEPQAARRDRRDGAGARRGEEQLGQTLPAWLVEPSHRAAEEAEDCGTGGVREPG